MIVSDDVRSDVRPHLDDLIVERARRALRARERQRPEFDLAWACGLPGPDPAITVDSSVQLSAGEKLDGVLRAIVGRQRRVIHALELHQLPRRAGKLE